MLKLSGKKVEKRLKKVKKKVGNVRKIWKVQNDMKYLVFDTWQKRTINQSGSSHICTPRLQADRTWITPALWQKNQLGSRLLSRVFPSATHPKNLRVALYPQPEPPLPQKKDQQKPHQPKKHVCDADMPQKIDPIEARDAEANFVCPKVERVSGDVRRMFENSSLCNGVEEFIQNRDNFQRLV